MRNRILRVMVLIGCMLALAYPAVAGGWATVRLDQPPGEVVAGEPWRFGFVVKQHDRMPTNDVEPVVVMVNTETGERVEFTAEQVGEVGHFEAEVTVPTAGDWKWEIVPAPFPGTSFETLAVLPAAGMAASGTEAVTPTTFTWRGVRITFTIDISPMPDEVTTADKPAESVEVSVLDGSFAPSRLEIAPGTEVVWTNTSSVAHTVMSDELSFSNSGLLDQGDTFRQVFTEPGTYQYRCGPHPSMVGTIVVTEQGASPEG